MYISAQYIKLMQKSVIEYLEMTVKAFPNKTAVRDSEMSITFNELWTYANRIALSVNSKSLSNTPVGVYLPKGGKIVVSIAAMYRLIQNRSYRAYANKIHSQRHY